MLVERPGDLLQVRLQPDRRLGRVGFVIHAPILPRRIRHLQSNPRESYSQSAKAADSFQLNLRPLLAPMLAWPMTKSLCLSILMASFAACAAPIEFLSSPRQTSLLELYTSEGCSS